VGPPVDSARVLRGGSWNNNQENARSAYRNRNHPNNRNNNIGFRVVSSSHIFPFPPGPGAFAPGGYDKLAMRTCRASGVVRRPRFADPGEGGEMARARPVRTAWQDHAGRRRAHTEQGRRPDLLPRRPASPIRR